MSNDDKKVEKAEEKAECELWKKERKALKEHKREAAALLSKFAAVGHDLMELDPTWEVNLVVCSGESDVGGRIFPHIMDLTVGDFHAVAKFMPKGG